VAPRHFDNRRVSLFPSFRKALANGGKIRDAEIRSNVYKSLLLNSISLASIYAFDFMLLPLVQERRTFVPRNLGWFYQTLWLLPVVGISFYLNVRRHIFASLPGEFLCVSPRILD
jgi:etoposide-induced 2.4 mRNA